MVIKYNNNFEKTFAYSEKSISETNVKRNTNLNDTLGNWNGKC